jgi:hypothetical protein
MPLVNYKQIACAFREQLSRLKDLGELPVGMEHFPAGCCGVVSEMLGDYLRTHHGLDVEYVWGDNDWGDHAWLECEGVVIDITSDQFQNRPPVFFAAKDSWYTSWEEALRVPVSSGCLDHDNRRLLGKVLSGAGLKDDS